jgi:hypothetical protein
VNTHPNFTSRVSWLAVSLAFAPQGLFLHYRYAGPVHLHIQNGNWFAHDDRQIQLDGSLNLHLFVRGDTGSYRLRRTFHRLSGYLKIGEQFQLLAAMIEGSLLANDSLHTAHPRRELCVFNVQFDIGGELAGMTVRAQVVGARYFRLTHRR